MAGLAVWKQRGRRPSAAIGSRCSSRAAELGGNLRWASIVHPANASFLAHLLAEVAASDAEIRLGQMATAESLAALSPDAIVVATGGRLVEPEVPGREHAHGLLEVVRDDVVLARRVAIVGGSLASIQLAEHLAGRGHVVTVLEAGETVAPEIGWKRKTEHLDVLDRLGVTVHTEVLVEGLVAEGVRFTPAGGPSRLHAADSIVVVGTVQPDLALHAEIVAAAPGVPVTAVGDCAEPGLIQKAVLDGARAGTLA